MKVDWLIVGAGLTGATLAERIATQLDQQVLVIDRRPHVGGNAHDYYDESGILVHRYGPHIFHTNSRKVWLYLSQFTRWRHYEHKVVGLVDGRYMPIPFNLNSLYHAFPHRMAGRLESALLKAYPYGSRIPILKLKTNPDPAIQFVADYVYKNIFYGYTLKQWEVAPEELDPSVTARVPIRMDRDDRYFQDVYQSIPALGYTHMVSEMLNHRNIKILLQADFKDLSGVRLTHLIYTGPIDEYFDRCYGALPYRSVRFEIERYNRTFVQEVGTINYPNNYDFTRATELKHITGQITPDTIVMREYPEKYVPGDNEAYYPIPRVENDALYSKYANEARRISKRVLFAGRLADYKYYNMDQAVGRALSLFEKTIAGLRG